ncbi:MAG: hypothetical protein QXD70_05520, partial [Candidatus Bathyarchaeia archaeon]
MIAKSPNNGLEYSEKMCNLKIFAEFSWLTSYSIGLQMLSVAVVNAFTSETFASKRMVKYAVELGLKGDK